MSEGHFITFREPEAKCDSCGEGIPCGTQLFRVRKATCINCFEHALLTVLAQHPRTTSPSTDKP